ncbi:MAG: InlB B-repeat-containing protein, partial [Clostridia bacterium]|nr:InlB B-repeat-containing protein [Clostridia bacterium]
MTYKKSFYLFLLIISVLSLFLSINILIKANEVSSLNLTSETIEISNANLIDDNKSSTDDSDKTSILNQSSPVSPDENYSGNCLERETGSYSSPIGNYSETGGGNSSFDEITEVRSGNSGSANSVEQSSIENDSKSNGILNLETQNLENLNQNGTNAQGIVPSETYSVGPYYSLYAYYSNDRQIFYTGSSGGLVCFAESQDTDQFGNPTNFRYVSDWRSNTGYYGNYPRYFNLCAQTNANYKFYGFWEMGRIEANGKPSGIDNEAPKDYRKNGPLPYNVRPDGMTYYAVFIHKDASKPTNPDPDPPIEYGPLEIYWGYGIEYISVTFEGYTNYYYSSPFSRYFDDGDSLIVKIYSRMDEGYLFSNINCDGALSWEWPTWYYSERGPTITFWTYGTSATVWINTELILETICSYCHVLGYDAATDTLMRYSGGPAMGYVKATKETVVDPNNVKTITTYSHSMYKYHEKMIIYARPPDDGVFLGWYKQTYQDPGSDYFGYLWRSADNFNVTKTTDSNGDTVYYTLSDYNTGFLQYNAVFEVKKFYRVRIVADPGVNVAGGTRVLYYNEGDILNIKDSSTSIFNITMSDGYGFDGWEIKTQAPVGFNVNSLTQPSDLKMISNYVYVRAKSNSNKYGVRVVAVSSTDTGTFVYDGITSPGGLVGFSIGTEISSIGPSSIHYLNIGNYVDMAVSNINSNFRFIGWYKTVSATGYDNLHSEYGTNPSETITEAMVAGKNENNVVLTYFAVFCKQYMLTNNAESETDKFIATTQSKQYYFTEQIRLFADVSENYNWDGWTLVSGTLPKRIDGTDMDLYSLNQIIIMPASGLTISAKTSIKIYAIEIIACYQDNTGNIYQATIGGKVSLGGEFSATRMGVVEHGSLITLGVQLNDNVGTDMLYALKGWYLDINGTQPFFSYNAPQTKETYIYEQFEITESMVLYAIITTCYKCIIEKDEGIASTTKSGSAYYFSNDELQVTATVKDKHIFDGWYKKETGGTESLHTSNPTFSYQVKQNIIFTAKTTKEFNLNVIEMTQNSMGGYNQFPIGGTVQDGLIFAGTILVDLVEVNNGFQFDGFFYNSYLTNPYNGTTMENNDMTLYAKFIRKSYPISLITKYTNSSDNNTLITGFGGGTCVGPYSDISSGKYGYTYPLETSANAGFEFYGIYTSNVSRISGNAPYMLANGSCNFSTPSIPIGGITICVVFSRAFYNVTLDVGKETNLTVNGLNNGKAYYGQSLSYTVTAKNGYANPSIEVFKTATGVSVLYNSSNFTMPETAITVRSSATAISYDLTYNPNGGAFSTETYPNSILNGNILGEIAYETKNYKYLIGSQTVPGVPLPGRAGYKIIGWNTESNGSGEYYVSYNDENVTYKEWDRLSDLTLYAVWEAVKPLLSLTQYINEFTYDGKYHEVLNVIVQNYVAGKTYLYEWINSGSGEIIFSEQGTYGNHTLQLRTPNESGIFSIYCRVTIVGEGLSERTVGEKTVRINKKELTVILGNREMVGDYSFWLTETDLIGLADGHRLQSGSLSFASSADEITYSETSNKNAIDRTITLSTIDSSQGHLPVTQQDGKDLIDNYIIKYSGEVKIKNPTDYIQLIVGGYERTVNPTTFSDVYKTTTLVGLDFEIEYESLESDLIRNEDGTQSVYIDWATVPRNLIFKFSAVPAGYKIYRISGGNIFLDSSDFTVTESGVIEVEFNLKSGMISTDENLIDIKIYFTNQAVVTYNYEFLGDELFGGYASYDGVNKRILTNGIIYPISANAAQPTRKGFNFDGWFYDEEKILYPVGTTWLKTGIITIYAKWTLRNITAADITITAKDNGIEMEKPFTRTYNTNTIALDYILNPEIKNPVISYEDMWYKWTGTGSSYYRIYNISLKNVADSGRYGVFIKPTYNDLTAAYTFNLDNKNEQVTITPQEITLALQISKTYDATTALGAYNIDGVGGELLRLLGSYSTANAGVAVPMTDLGLQGYGGSNAANYTLTNTQYNGIINPYSYEINMTDEKDYDGNYYTSVFNRDITLIGETQTLTFTLITNGANCGLY